MTTAYDRIRTGLEEALAFARGEGTGVVHHVHVPPHDARAPDGEDIPPGPSDEQPA